MAATPNIIPTDLTLEIGDDPSPERFMAAVAAFFGYVAEISSQVAPKGEVPRWVVRVKEGSDLIALQPIQATQYHASVYKRAERGFRALAEDGTHASDLSEAAIGHLTTLSKLASGPKGHPMYLRLWVERTPIEIDATIASKVREEEAQGYHDFGTVEGRLDTVQDRDGDLQFRVKDALVKQTVRCYLTEEQLEEAFKHFRHRVEISGVIHYRKDGTPISIRVERVEGLPDDSELPTPDEVRGILRVIA